MNGIAGGSYFIAAALHWLGRPQDMPVVRLGYIVAAHAGPDANFSVAHGAGRRPTRQRQNRRVVPPRRAQIV